MKKHSVKLASLFSQEEIDAIKNLVQQGSENSPVEAEDSDVEYSEPNIPDSSNLNPAPDPAPDPLHIEKQKAILLYAPKEDLWKIVDHDEGWLDLLSEGLPPEYLEHFSKRMSDLAIRDPKVLANMAEMYVKFMVSQEHLAAAISKHWDPQDLAEATQFLHDNDFLEQPLLPINLRA